MSSKSWISCFFLIVLSLTLPQGLPAQTALPTETSAEAARDAEAPAPAPDPVPAELRSARATLTTFFTSFKQTPEDLQGRDPLEVAASCLDLAHLSSDVRSLKGGELAIQLKKTIDRIIYVVLDEVPDDASAPPYVILRSDLGEIVVARSESGAWLFTQKTVEAIPDLLRSVEDRQLVEGVEEAPETYGLWLRGKIPSALKKHVIFLELWQWLGLLLVIFLGVVVDKTVVFVLTDIVARWVAKRFGRLDKDLLTTSLRPVGMVAMSVLWGIGLLVLDLPTGIFTVLYLAVRLVGTTAVVWAAYRFVDILGAVLTARAAATEGRFDDLLIPLVCKSLKVLVFVFGLVFVAEAMDVQIKSLLAGLGLGGLAVALAAQDTVKNLFGSLTVLLDRPFQVGDWIVIGDTEGTVEELGFRSTRVRTFYNSLITVPNAALIDAQVDNLGARRFRRWSTHLGLAYDTKPEKIEAFCEGVREIIRRHPYTRKDYFHVYLNRFGDASLDVILYVFFDAPEWSTELRERHRLGVDILRLAAELGVEFAFPTQTLYLKRGGERVEEPSPPDYGSIAQDALASGRRVARDLVDNVLHGEVPPPVSAHVSSVENRGEDGEG